MAIFPPLALPPAPLQIEKNEQGRWLVFDELRRRQVTLTPEEWVRQHFVHHLIHDLGYPTGLLTNEMGLKVGKVLRRCDTILFARSGATPQLIVEYKAPEVSITEAVFWQVQSYNSVLRAPYLIVSNGLHHFVCHTDHNTNRLRFLKNIPHYHEL